MLHAEAAFLQGEDEEEEVVVVVVVVVGTLSMPGNALGLE